MTATFPAPAPAGIGTTTADRLRAVVRGEVLTPTDSGYAELAPPFNLAGAFEPVAVVRVLDAADLAAAVRLAADCGAEVTVRATGHGAAPRDHRPDTILVDTSRLDELSIEGRTARIGAGVRWGRVLDEAGALGLAAPAGSAPAVGVVGYLTGGGLSPVGRSTGWASDHVVAFEVVTGDGVLRRASAHENPALFWGLRGGKGSLGIVTAVELGLVELPTILGGSVFLDAATDADVLEAWAEWPAALPREASTSVAIMRLPATPGIPEPIAGRTTIAIRFAWTGAPEQGRALIDGLVGDRPVLLGGYGEMPFSQMGVIHSDPVDPMPVVTSAALLGSLPVDAVRALAEVAGPQSDCPQVMVELRLLGGALSEPPADGLSAVGHRDAAYLLHTVGLAVPPLIDAVTGNVAALHQAMATWTTDGMVPNFGSWSTPEGVASQYDADTLARLAGLAAAYDPRGVLADATMLRAAYAERA